MKNKMLLLMMCMLGSLYGHAQYSFLGRLLYTNNQPVKNKQVFLRADSTINPTWMPTFNLSTYTDTNGFYSFTMPGSVVNGMKVMSRTVDCNNVVLVNTHTYTGSNITGSDFSICINPAPVISGQISLGTGSVRAANAKVLLLERVFAYTDGVRDYYSIKRLDSIIASSNGNFAFSYPSGVSGKLLVHAMLQPTSPNYNKYLPTYSGGALQWDAADTLGTGVSSIVNIVLKSVNNPGGTSYATGFVQAGTGSGFPAGTALSNRTIILTDANDNPVAYTLSDNIGTFSFTGLPYAGYKVFVDNYGKYCTPLLFTVGTSYPAVTHIKFEELAYMYNAGMPPLGIAETSAARIRIYPNPASNYLHVQGLSSAATMQVYDVTGRLVATQTLLPQDARIGVSHLQAGNYIAKLITTTEVRTQQFVKE